jgi:hypothetical protein
MMYLTPTTTYFDTMMRLQKIIKIDQQAGASSWRVTSDAEMNHHGAVIAATRKRYIRLLRAKAAAQKAAR